MFGELREELLRFLIARTGDRTDAEDMLQEVWLRIGAADSGPIANGRAYIYRVAQNLALDSARDRRRRERRESDWVETNYAAQGSEPADNRANAADIIIERQETEALAAAIDNLPDGAGRAFRLHKIDGLSHAEVAARLGISKSGVEKHIAVAMAHLRRALRTEV